MKKAVDRALPSTSAKGIATAVMNPCSLFLWKYSSFHSPPQMYLISWSLLLRAMSLPHSYCRESLPRSDRSGCEMIVWSAPRRNM